MKAKPEDDFNMQPVGFRITWILTDYAQKFPGHYCSTCKLHNKCSGHLSTTSKLR